MAAKYMHRIKMHCMMFVARLPKYRTGTHRLYCYARSETSCVKDTFESVENCKDFKKSASKLFLTGKDASLTFAVFCPELDFDYIIDNYNEISKDLKRRKIVINLPVLIENLKIIKELKKQINDIDEARAAIVDNFNAVSENSPDPGREEAIKNEGKALREKLKALNTVLWSYEDATFPELAKLPSSIHAETPSQNQVLTEHGIKGEFLFYVKSHVELGKLSQTVKFSNVNPSAYYLCGIAAILELAICNYFSDNMINAGFLSVVNPDFCKSVILEGCGKPLQEISQYITLKAHQVDGHSFHLTGTASLEGFAATLSRIIVNNPSLPLQYFSIGRCYTSAQKNEQNLFSVAQAVKVTAFVASMEGESMNHFSSLVEIIETTYKNINLPFRSIKIAAYLLKPAESLRVEFSLWSPHKKEFVNVAHVSLCTDYISRRLMMKHGTERKAEAFLHIVEATVTSLPVLIGSIMENMQTAEGKFSIPDIFKPYINNILKT